MAGIQAEAIHDSANVAASRDFLVVGAVHELPLQRDELPLREDELPLQNQFPLQRQPGGDEFPPAETLQQRRLYRRRMLLPKLVGYIKMNSAKAINRLLDSSGVPVWQRNYFEHVIQSGGELERVRKYIRNNPANWEQDEIRPG
jgi:hypothetical protein